MKDGVVTRRTIVFSVHVPGIRPKVAIRCGRRGSRRLKTRTPSAVQLAAPLWLER